MKEINLLGLRVKDRVTGFSGVVESVSYDLYGCIQAVVRPSVNEKGELPDGRWFDVSRLEVLTGMKPVMDIPGGRFNVERVAAVAGPAEKPRR